MSLRTSQPPLHPRGDAHHGYIDEAWLKKLPPPDVAEEGMISCAFHVRPNSRLTCQIQVTPALDGLVVRLPVSQTSE